MPESLYDESWTMIKEFRSQIDVEIAMDLLHQAGIPCYKLNGTADHYWKGRGFARLFVKFCDRTAAQKILDELEKDAGIPEDELAEEALSAPSPEETDSGIPIE